MYFIRCNHCGNLNAVKTEYQTFCESCKKKIANNFQDWKKVNPAKSFNNYKHEACEQNDKPHKKSANSAPDSSKSRLDLIVLISSIVVFVILGIIFSKQITAFTKLAYARYNAGLGKYSAANPDAWQRFSSADGNFEIIFPGQPSKNNQMANTEIGELKLVMYVFTPQPGTDDNLNYIVGHTQYPAYTIDSRFMTGIEIDGFLDQSVQGSAQNVNGVIIENSKVNYENFPGRKFTISLEQGKAVMKGVSYLVNRTLYSINVIEPSQNKDNASTSKFMESFNLLSMTEDTTP